MFVADGHKGLTVINVENPRFPQILRTFDIGGSAQGIKMDNTSSTVFIMTKNVGVKVINIIDILEPKLLANITTLTATKGAQNPFMFDVSGDGRIVVTYSTAVEATTSSSGTTFSQVYDSITGTYVEVEDFSSHHESEMLHVFTRLEGPNYTLSYNRTSSSDADGGNVQGLALFKDGKSLYLGQNGGLFVMDLTNPTTPTYACAEGTTSSCYANPETEMNNGSPPKHARRMALNADESSLFAMIPRQSGAPIATVFKVNADRTVVNVGQDTSSASSVFGHMMIDYSTLQYEAGEITVLVPSVDGSTLYTANPSSGRVMVKSLIASGSLNYTGTVEVSYDKSHAKLYEWGDITRNEMRFVREQFAVSHDGKYIFMLAYTACSGCGASANANLTVLYMPQGADADDNTFERRSYLLDADLSTANAVWPSGSLWNPVFGSGVEPRCGNTGGFAGGGGPPPSTSVQCPFVGFNVRVSPLNLVVITHNSSTMSKYVYALSNFENDNTGVVAKTAIYTFDDEIAISHGSYVQASNDDETIWVGVRSACSYRNLCAEYPQASAKNVEQAEIIVMDFSSTPTITSTIKLPANGGGSRWNYTDGVTHLVLSADDSTVYARSVWTGDGTGAPGGYLYTLDIRNTSNLVVETEGTLTVEMSPQQIIESPDRSKLYAVESGKIIVVTDISDGRSPSVMKRYQSFCGVMNSGAVSPGDTSIGPIDSIYPNHDGSRLEIHCRNRKGWTDTSTGRVVVSFSEFLEVLDVISPSEPAPLVIIGDPDLDATEERLGWRNWVFFPLKSTTGDSFFAEMPASNGIARHNIIAASADMYIGPTKARGEFKRQIITDSHVQTGGGGLFDEFTGNAVADTAIRLAGSKELLSTYGFITSTSGFGTNQVEAASVDSIFAGKMLSFILPYEVADVDSSNQTIYVRKYQAIEFYVHATVRAKRYKTYLSFSTPEAMLAVTLTLDARSQETFVSTDDLSTQATFTAQNKIVQLFGIQSAVNSAMKELRYHSTFAEGSANTTPVSVRVTDLITPELPLSSVGVSTLNLSSLTYNEHPSSLVNDVRVADQVLGRAFDIVMNVTTWFGDEDDSELTYTLQRVDNLSMPSWLTFDTDSDPPRLSGTTLSSTSSSKTYNVTSSAYEENILLSLSASDGFSSSLININLRLKNEAPRVVADCLTQVNGMCHTGNFFQILGKSFEHTLNRSWFADNDMLTSQSIQFDELVRIVDGNAISLPTWLTFNAQTLTLRGSAESKAALSAADFISSAMAYEQRIDFKLTAREIDSTNFPDSKASVLFTLIMVNHAPINNVTGIAFVVVSGSETTIALQQYFDDYDRLPLSFRIEGVAGGTAPGFMRLDPTGEFLILAPSATNAGRHSVTVFASDGVNDEVSTTISIKVRRTELEEAQWWLLTILSALSGISTLLSIYGFFWLLKNYWCANRHWKIIEPSIKTETDVMHAIEGHTFLRGKKGKKEIGTLEDVEIIQMVQILSPKWYHSCLSPVMQKYLSSHPLFDGRSVPTWLEFDKKNLRLKFKEQYFHTELEAGLHYVLLMKASDKSTLDTLDLNFTKLSDNNDFEDSNRTVVIARAKRSTLAASQ